MSVQRFVTKDPATGRELLKEAVVESAGAADGGKIPAFTSAGHLHETALPPGIGAELVVAPASENLAAGDFVNRWDDEGTLKIRLADAGNNRPANGFVRAAVTAPAVATVYPLGTINGERSGLTLDATYFLSKTPGGVTTDVSGFENGDIVQEIGAAFSATEILTERHTPATLTAA